VELHATAISFDGPRHRGNHDSRFEDDFAIGTYATEVISVSTAPIPDSMFEIPADYTVTKR
jgi:hypothetical protein